MPHSLCISWTSPSFPWSTSAEIAKNKTTLSYPELEKYIIEYKRTSSENYLFHSSNNSGYRIKFTTYSPLADIPPTSRPRACSSAWKCAKNATFMFFEIWNQHYSFMLDEICISVSFHDHCSPLWSRRGHILSTFWFLSDRDKQGGYKERLQGEVPAIAI